MKCAELNARAVGFCPREHWAHNGLLLVFDTYIADSDDTPERLERIIIGAQRGPCRPACRLSANDNSLGKFPQHATFWRKHVPSKRPQKISWS